MVEQFDGGVRLILGRAVAATSDTVASTQAWVTELEGLLTAYPQEWQFSVDKHWSRVLRPAPRG
jgi:hypothetical protein